MTKVPMVDAASARSQGRDKGLIGLRKWRGVGNEHAPQNIRLGKPPLRRSPVSDSIGEEANRISELKH